MPPKFALQTRPGRQRSVLLASLCAALLLYVFFTSSEAPSPAPAAPQSGASQLSAPTLSPIGVAPQPTPPIAELLPDSLSQQAEVVAETSSQPDADGTLLRTRIIKSTVAAKYPWLRIEERIQRDALSGRETVTTTRAMVADHIIVKLRPGMSLGALEGLNRKHGTKVRKTLRAPGLYLIELSARDVAAVTRAVAAYTREAKLVAYAEPDYVVSAGTIPNDTHFGNLWGLVNTGQLTGTPGRDIEAAAAWELCTGSAAVKVGVIDTGVDYTHLDLAPNIWLNPGESGVDANGQDKATNGSDDDNNGYVDDVRGWDFYGDDNNPMDDHSHGTHVAGTIGAVGNNGIGVAGVCWEVSLIPLKFLGASGSGTTSDAVQAIYYATGLGVTLTSNSWGGGGHSQALVDAIDDADQHGILFVAAAGNAAVNTDNGAHYPSSYSNPNIISVAATTSTDSLASFSNYGAATVDLAAPGNLTYSCLPNNGYGYKSGTSMATPHVSGACALLKAAMPALSAVAIRNLLLSAAEPVPGLAGKCVTGARLNVFRLLQQASGAYVTLKDKILDDDALAGTSGNADGRPNSGERIGLTLRLDNIGLQQASNVVATLSSADPNITLVADTVAFGNLSAGAQLASPTPYLIDIDALTPTPRSVTFTLTINSDQGARSDQFALTVYKACQISGRVVRAATGNPIDGATIQYTGPLSGSVLSGADGSYALQLIDGAYTLAASAPGYIPGVTVQLTVPPDAANVDLPLGNPDIDIAPAALAITVERGAKANATLTVTNAGDVPLNYRSLADDYSATTSDQVGGPAYGWIDISAGGTPVTGLSDEANVGPFPIGFPFKFYGEKFTHFRICSNGYLSFTSEISSYLNLALPNASAPPRLLAFFWSDLDFDYGGQAFYQLIDPDTLVLQFEAVPFYAYPDQTVTCQLVLKSDGSMLFQYKQLTVAQECTVGIQNAAGNKGLTVVHNAALLHNNMAIRIRSPYLVPWLAQSPEAGTLNGSASQSLTLTADADNLPPGNYAADLSIGSNDPAEPLLQLPVNLTVLSAPHMALAQQLIDDDATLPSTGDADAAAEPGETIELNVILRNIGEHEATGLTGTLSTADPNVQILNASSAFPDALPNQLVASASQFVINVDPNIPNNHSVNLTLNVSADGGRSWDISLALTVAWRCTLSGTITDLASGQPLSNAAITLGDLSAVSDVSGAYWITGIPAGGYVVVASQAGYMPSYAHISIPGDQEHDFTLGFPDISVAPASLSQIIQEGSDGTSTLGVNNQGSLPLAWRAGGYVFSNSDEPEGPDYAWIDISATGTLIPGLGDETNLGPFNIGFDFPFYGQTFSTFRLGSNGYLSFSSSTVQFFNTGLPSQFAPPNLVAFFWNDLDFTPGGQAYYQQTDANTLVVQFKNVSFYEYPSQKVSCEVILKRDGTILFQYQALDIADYCTVGVQNAARDNGVQVAYLQTLLHAGMALKLAPLPNWLSVTPVAGDIWGGDQSTVTVHFATAGLGAGNYSGALQLASDDLETRWVSIPINLKINRAPVGAAQNLIVTEDTALDITLSASDANSDPVTCALAASPAHGTLSGAPPNLRYTPTADYNGPDSFSFRPSDATSDGAVTWVSLNVLAVNDAPVAHSQNLATSNTLALTLSASDADGDPLSYSIVDAPLAGSLTGTAPDLHYRPQSTYAGTDRFTFRVSDGNLASALATVSIVISQADEPVGSEEVEWTSAPTASPTPAAIGQLVTFSAGARDPKGRVLAFTWQFGDGSSASGATARHAYSVAGEYNALVSVSTEGALLRQAIRISVLAPLVGAGIDSDGDGFSDQFENAMDTSALDPDSTPIGEFAAKENIQRLSLSRASVKLSFAKPGNDSIALAGTLTLAEGCEIDGARLGIDFGGIVRAFTLDGQGRAKTGADMFALRFKTKAGVTAAQNAAWQLKLSRGAFVELLSASQLTNENLKNAPRTVLLTLCFGDTVYQAAHPLVYSAMKNKSGRAVSAQVQR